MELTFSDISEFERHFSKYYPLDVCDCGGNREIELTTAIVKIDTHKIIIAECPVLTCQKCGMELIGHRVPLYIYKAYSDFADHPGNDICHIRLKGEGRFEYAEKADFAYDSRDLNIPGCDVDLDPCHKDGYSLPVFFDRKVLNNFFLDPDYELDFFSESYGEIAKLGTDGWDYDWRIPFGVNVNDKVILFLGDLDQVEDERAILWLKSYNIPSDHILVSTELYQAQMKSIFSHPIIEERIVMLMDGFYKKIQSRYSISLYHLEEEVETQKGKIKKPISYTEREISANIVALDGILNEGISQDGLRDLCRKLNVTKKNLNDLKTRKLLQAIIETKEGASAGAIISPLFHLNDLRVCFSHLLPSTDVQQYKNNIVAAYGLTSFSDYRKLYDSLIAELYKLYQYLYITDF